MPGLSESHAKAERQLQDALAAIPRSRPAAAWATGSGVRESVCAYVTALKADGEPPERVLKTLKALVRAAVGPTLSWRDLDAVMERTVQWCIEEYYRQS